MICERACSDYRLPDIGQQLNWQLSWEHTTLLTEDAQGDPPTPHMPVERKIIAAFPCPPYYLLSRIG